MLHAHGLGPMTGTRAREKIKIRLWPLLLHDGTRNGAQSALSEEAELKGWPPDQQVKPPSEGTGASHLMTKSRSKANSQWLRFSTVNKTEQQAVIPLMQQHPAGSLLLFRSHRASKNWPKASDTIPILEELMT